MLITTTRGLVDESALLKTDGRIDTATETTTWVEYCPIACLDPVHQTQQPAQGSFFCPSHIHRSVHVHLKQGVFAASAVGSF